MLHLHHVPLSDRLPTAQGFPVGAEIIAYSGEPFIDGTPEVLWTTDGNWNSVAMTHVAGNDYMGFIPAQLAGREVQYYIHAEDGSGRSGNHPFIGAPDAHRFTVSRFGDEIRAPSAEIGGVIDFCLTAESAQADFQMRSRCQSWNTQDLNRRRQQWDRCRHRRGLGAVIREALSTRR
jgi:hypothetical protein